MLKSGPRHLRCQLFIRIVVVPALGEHIVDQSDREQVEVADTDVLLLSFRSTCPQDLPTYSCVPSHHIPVMAADLGLSPFGTCARWAHQKNHPVRLDGVILEAD